MPIQRPRPVTGLCSLARQQRPRNPRSVATRCFEEVQSPGERVVRVRPAHGGARAVLMYYMANILDRVLEARGFGWTLLRFAIILTPAILALILLSSSV